jgi:polysaccharide chain length determinant protein (PEP-CTERM system associated)
VSAHTQPYSLDAILRMGRRRKWQIVLPALVIACAASWWIHGLPDRFRSFALLLVVSQRVAETFVQSTVPARGDHRLQAITQQILSRTQLERIILDFDLYADERKSDSMQDVVDSMRTRDIEIRSVKGDAFRLGFSADSPEVAMRVAERLVSLFIRQNSLDRATLAEGTDHFLETQLEEARRRLADYETNLAEYRRRHNGELPTQLEASVRGMHNTEMQLQLLADSLNRDRDRQLGLERSAKDANLREVLEARDRVAPADPSTLTPPEQLERAEASLKDLQSTLTEQHPDVVTMKQTIAELRQHAERERRRQAESAGVGAAEALRRNHLEQLRAELSAVERQLAQKTAEEERLRGVLLAYQRRIELAPTREAELAALTRDYDTLQQIYRGLLAKKQESQIAANLERQQVDAHFKMLDAPRLPEQPDAPNRRRLYILGLIAALGIGVIGAAILERFDRGLRTRDAVRTALDLPVLAAIPQVSSPRSIGRLAAALVLVALAICACAAALSWRLLK